MAPLVFTGTMTTIMDIKASAGKANIGKKKPALCQNHRDDRFSFTDRQSLDIEVEYKKKKKKKFRAELDFPLSAQ